MDKSSILYKFLKSLELGYKRIVYNTYKLFFNRKRIEGKLNPHTIKTIVIFRNDKIGDMVVTFPMLRYLKMINPNFHLILYCSEYNKYLAQNCPDADEIIVEKSSIFADFKHLFAKRNVDLMINTLSQKMSNNLMRNKFISGDTAIRAMRYSQHLMIDFYNMYPSSETAYNNMTEKMLSLIYDIFETDLTIDQVPINFPIAQNADNIVKGFIVKYGFDSYTLINLSTGQKKNEWTQVGYIELVKKLLNETNTNIIIVNTPSEKEFANTLLSKFTNNRLQQYPETKNLFEIAGIIKYAEMVITPDTAIVHFASLCGTPLLALYNGDGHNLNDWSPFNTQFKIVMAEPQKKVQDIQFAKVWSAYLELEAQINKR